MLCQRHFRPGSVVFADAAVHCRSVVVSCANRIVVAYLWSYSIYMMVRAPTRISYGESCRRVEKWKGRADADGGSGVQLKWNGIWANYTWLKVKQIRFGTRVLVGQQLSHINYLFVL